MLLFHCCRRRICISTLLPVYCFCNFQVRSRHRLFRWGLGHQAILSWQWTERKSDRFADEKQSAFADRFLYLIWRCLAVCFFLARRWEFRSHAARISCRCPDVGPSIIYLYTCPFEFHAVRRTQPMLSAHRSGTIRYWKWTACIW